MWMLRNDISFELTVPVFCDSQAAVQITANERPSRKTRHIERRWFYARQLQQRGLAKYIHVNGDALMLADPLTKAKSSLDPEVAYK